MSQAAPSHLAAIELLRREHQVIESVLCAMQWESDQIDQVAQTSRQFWIDSLEFLSEFAERSHYEKEESCLFPALIAAGITDRGGPVGVLRAEHQASHAALQRIAKAQREGDLAELTVATRTCVAMLRDHISKEEKVLYVLAERVLSASDAIAVWAAMQRQARTRDAYEMEHLLRLAAALCAHAGTPLVGVEQLSTSTDHEPDRTDGWSGSETKETER
ncbi:MAG: hemerythrin domain-containing protein [Acidobacteriota bacterium]